MSGSFLGLDRVCPPSWAQKLNCTHVGEVPKGQMFDRMWAAPILRSLVGEAFWRRNLKDCSGGPAIGQLMYYSGILGLANEIKPKMGSPN